jgi:outer membrane protein assembly factor BamE (lipoprotein component of BamABCDE complex)
MSTTHLKCTLAVVALVNALAVMAADGHNSQNATTAAHMPESQRVRDFSDTTLAKIIPGQTIKAEVEALLGQPWRETELDEEDIMYPGDPAVEVWEYRGREPNGTYRVHIQFDKHDVTSLIAKIPDKTARAVARVSKPTVDPAKP